MAYCRWFNVPPVEANGQQRADEGQAGLVSLDPYFCLPGVRDDENIILTRQDLLGFCGQGWPGAIFQITPEGGQTQPVAPDANGYQKFEGGNFAVTQSTEGSLYRYRQLRRIRREPHGLSGSGVILWRGYRR